MDRQNMYDAPIPGQSLTNAPGSFAFEKPPQYSKEDEALSYLWDVEFQKPKTVTRITVLIKGGVAITEIVNTILYAGITAGKWNLDLAFLMYQKVAWMVEALAKIRNIKYTFKRIDPKYAQFLIDYKDYIRNPDDSEVEQAINQTLFKGMKAE